MNALSAWDVRNWEMIFITGLNLLDSCFWIERTLLMFRLKHHASWNGVSFSVFLTTKFSPRTKAVVKDQPVSKDRYGAPDNLIVISLVRSERTPHKVWQQHDMVMKYYFFHFDTTIFKLGAMNRTMLKAVKDYKTNYISFV